MYPHLPSDYPRAVIINPDAGEKIVNFFKNHNINIIFSKKAQAVSSSVAMHPDIQISHIRDDVYVVAPEFYDYYREMLSPYDVKVYKGQYPIGSNYPDDIAYNVLRVGETLFAKLSSTDKVCLFHFMESGVKCVDVSQGYAKCNGCIVDENSLITSDVSIYKNAIENGVDALLINPGFIKLKGFDYGFIGGASFKLDKNTLCFTGDISHHKDYDRIIEFAKNKNIDIVTITDDFAEDFGSVILVF